LPKCKQYPIVEVIWIDAEEHGDVGWNDLKSQLAHARKPCPQMKSVGYCVYRDDEHISLLSTIGYKESSTLEKIPLGFVVSVRELTETIPDAKL
jgi:hypothetical protein